MGDPVNQIGSRRRGRTNKRQTYEQIVDAAKSGDLQGVLTWLRTVHLRGQYNSEALSLVATALDGLRREPPQRLIDELFKTIFSFQGRILVRAQRLADERMDSYDLRRRNDNALDEDSIQSLERVGRITETIEQSATVYARITHVLSLMDRSGVCAPESFHNGVEPEADNVIAMDQGESNDSHAAEA